MIKRDFQNLKVVVMAMLVRVIGLDSSYERTIAHLLQLYYDEVRLTFDRDAEAMMSLDFTLSEGTKLAADVTVTFEKREVRATAAKRVSLLSAAERSRQKKKVASQALLKALHLITGIRQPWGILTGIRPMKLWHRAMQNGLSEAEVRRHIAEETMLMPEKMDLMQTIARRQLEVIPDLYDLKHEVSIYIGIPFCPTKCAYCTFPAYAIRGQEGSVDSFLDGLCYEMREIGKWLKDRGIGITTIYFGGGTPTSITAHEMEQLYAEMYRSFPKMDDVREITVEAGRPDTITREKLRVLRKWHIDRISINPQTYTDRTLEAIGRHHTVAETIEKFHLAREMGMRNINMDLIIGLPGEGLAEFEHTLSETAKLLPESLTVHTLAFKRASRMTKNKQKYIVAQPDEVVRMMDRAREWTTEQGYVPYYLYRQKNILGNLENVGYAFPGKESVYNVMIMEEQQTILGLGCGAASKLVHPVTGKITRFANPKAPRAYNESFVKYTADKLALLDQLYSSETRMAK